MKTLTTQFIAYTRVSTASQGASGLGLEGQDAAIEAYTRSHGGTILRAYREVESGKRADRPELARALAHAKRARATLVIAKLDRLARNVAFLSGLMEAGVDFVACDNPTANRLTIHILAAVAEAEAAAISARTRAALAAYKARGGLLGAARPECRRGVEAAAGARGSAASRALQVADARAAYADLAPLVREQHAGGKTLRQIAATLNAEGYTTRQGAAFGPQQVSRILNRA
jgi:DNA invertase Pin-like site-specific DNA recombinase